jgi:hypothetical protein
MAAVDIEGEYDLIRIAVGPRSSATSMSWRRNQAGPNRKRPSA